MPIIHLHFYTLLDFLDSELISVEIVIYPIQSTASFRQLQDLPVEVARCVKVATRKRNVKHVILHTISIIIVIVVIVAVVVIVDVIHNIIHIDPGVVT